VIRDAAIHTSSREWPVLGCGYRLAWIVIRGKQIASHELEIGGIGLEILSFEFAEASSGTAYNWTVAGEEFFEMAGMSVVLYGFMLLGIRIQTGDSVIDRE
jgi:hypothetical protein